MHDSRVMWFYSVFRCNSNKITSMCLFLCIYIACFEASNQGIWLRNFITGLQIIEGINKPLRINCDNKAVELYSKNNRSSSKSKHIDIKFLVVKVRVQSGQVSIEHISTNSMIADPLTKGLPPKVFHEHVAQMGILSLDDIGR